LFGDPIEKRGVTVDVSGVEGNPVYDRVKVASFQRRRDLVWLADVRCDDLRSRNINVTNAPVEEKQVDAAGHCQAAAGGADIACATDKENFHC
jgi:hypothetical protein